MSGRRHIRSFLCIHTCTCMHRDHGLNKPETPIFIFRFGRRRALCPETRATFRHLSLASVFHPVPRHFFGLPDLLVVVSVPRTSGAGGVEVRLRCSTWHPPRCPPPRRHRLHGNRRLLGRQLCCAGRLELAEAIKERGGLEGPWKKLPV